MGIAPCRRFWERRPAALYMALARSLIRPQAGRHASPSAVLTAVNRRLLVEAPGEMFVTVFYAVIDLLSRSLTYANTGHDPPFLFLQGEHHALTCVEKWQLKHSVMRFSSLSLPEWPRNCWW